MKENKHIIVEITPGMERIFKRMREENPEEAISDKQALGWLCATGAAAFLNWGLPKCAKMIQDSVDWVQGTTFGMN